MVDGWTDCSRRTLINFLVYYLKGTVFLRFVDASYASKTIEMLFKLFKQILYVGKHNLAFWNSLIGIHMEILSCKIN